MPHEIRIRGKVLERYTVRGVVARKPGPTMAKGGLVVLGPQGREQYLPGAAWMGAPRDRDEVSATWLVEHGSATGPYVALQNHTTREIRYNEAALTNLYRPAGTMVAAGAIVLLLAPFTVGAVAVALLLVAGHWYGVRGRQGLIASGRLLDQRQGSERRGAGRGRQPSSTTSQGMA